MCKATPGHMALLLEVDVIDPVLLVCVHIIISWIQGDCMLHTT